MAGLPHRPSGRAGPSVGSGSEHMVPMVIVAVSKTQESGYMGKSSRSPSDAHLQSGISRRRRIRSMLLVNRWLQAKCSPNDIWSRQVALTSVSCDLGWLTAAINSCVVTGVSTCPRNLTSFHLSARLLCPQCSSAWVLGCMWEHGPGTLNLRVWSSCGSVLPGAT